MRIVDSAGNTGEFSAVAIGRADPDPAPILAQMKGRITQSELSRDLFDLVNQPKGLSAADRRAVAEQVKQEVKTLQLDTAVVTEVKKVVSDLEGNMKSLYSLQTQAFGNGRRAISGIAVGADSKTAEGHIMMMADKVMFVDPNSNQIVPAMVVEVKNGRSTLGLNGDLIADGTIQGRHIAASQSIRSPKLEGGSINIGDGRFTVDSNGVVNISSSNGNVGLKIRNDFIGLWDDNQSLVVAIGFLG